MKKAIILGSTRDHMKPYLRMGWGEWHGIQGV